MIYVSTSCVKKIKISDSIETLALNGFKNIELSGGTKYYDGFKNDLLELKDKYELNYRCHNYFPPPKQEFVLNLASLDDKVHKASFDHLETALSLSNEIGADKFGFHAGFFIDIKLNQIGKKISRSNLFNRDESIERFCNSFRILKERLKGISLYIENNVFSKSNAETYNGISPFMMTNLCEYKSLKDKINFNLLLDVAHLKVSAKSLGLNWKNELEGMMDESDYIHISENDGFHDLNNKLTKGSDLLSILKNFDTKNKDFTLEVYGDINSVKSSYESLQLAIL